ncbi:MAG TPA: hypothetical protein PLY68_01060 [Myxococcota bacterium]|nr:hypothetical protein [Myxococcota bacterium]HQP94768.1 hypothetical protein [Myxococcota bacterium]
MTSIETISKLEPRFERIIKQLDLFMLIEHVRRLDPMAFARHFKGFRPQMLGRKRVVKALAFEVFTRHNEVIGDVLTLLWNQTRRDIYDAMHELVSTIDEDVESITEIPDERAHAFIDVLLEDFDREDILICVRLNDVRFHEPVISSRLEKGEDAPVETGDVSQEEVSETGAATEEGEGDSAVQGT